MQMMRNDKGVTMVVLVVTIVILLMLTTVGLNLSYSNINGMIDSKLNTELGMVKQAASEQYLKAVTVNKTKISLEETKVAFWIGKKITNFEDIALPDLESIVREEEVEAFYNQKELYAPVYQEDCYYRLTPADLSKIGIGDSKDTYIVNYKSGEVYNETKQVNNDYKLLYLPATNQKEETTTIDHTFDDWSE